MLIRTRAPVRIDLLVGGATLPSSPNSQRGLLLTGPSIDMPMQRFGVSGR